MEIIRIYQHKNLQLTKKEFYEKLSNFVEDNKESLVDKMSSYTYNNGKEEVIKQGHTKDSHINQSPRTMLLRNLSQNIPCSTFKTEERANQVLYAALKQPKNKVKIIEWFFKDPANNESLRMMIKFTNYLGKGIDLGFDEVKSSELTLILKRAFGDNELGFYIETAYPNLKTIETDVIEYTGRNFTDKAIEYNDDMDNKPFSRYGLMKRFMSVDDSFKITRGKNENEFEVFYSNLDYNEQLVMLIEKENIRYNINNKMDGSTISLNYGVIKENYKQFIKPMAYVIKSLKKADIIIARQFELDLE